PELLDELLPPPLELQPAATIAIAATAPTAARRSLRLHRFMMLLRRGAPARRCGRLRPGDHGVDCVIGRRLSPQRRRKPPATLAWPPRLRHLCPGYGSRRA